MAQMNAANSEIGYILETIWKGTVAGATDTEFVWETTNGHRIKAIGTGFTYFGALPLSGTVTRLEFDWVDKDHPLGVVDAVMTGFSARPSSLINPLDPPSGENSFWATLLAGNDQIAAPRIGGGSITGDFYNLAPEEEASIERTGGKDLIVASLTGSGGISLSRLGEEGIAGDAISLRGFDNGQGSLFTALLHGGNDTITMRGNGAYALYGDVLSVARGGTLDGGDDTITSDIKFIPRFGGVSLVGDAQSSSASVSGGNDLITGTNFAFTDEAITGDVQAVIAGGVTGGADTISGRAGQEFIAGDVYTMQGGRLIGGADSIIGGEDSDIISGELFGVGQLGGIVVVRDSAPTFAISLTGGNDTIIGGNGNDWIVGEIFSGEGIDGISKIAGGADFLSGGSGDDQLFGEIDGAFAGVVETGGNDTLDGGVGDDWIDGQQGFDTATFGSIAQAVVVDLVGKSATGQGDDTLLRIESVIGSVLGDQLNGSAGANKLDGNRGNDLLIGRAGNDSLIGGIGNDRLQGEGGGDVLNGGAGVDVFILGPAASGPIVTDRITDFADGVDKLDLAAYDFANFAAVKALTTGTTGGIRIDLPGSEILLLNGFGLAKFTADDVILT